MTTATEGALEVKVDYGNVEFFSQQPELVTRRGFLTKSLFASFALFLSGKGLLRSTGLVNASREDPAVNTAGWQIAPELLEQAEASLGVLIQALGTTSNGGRAALMPDPSGSGGLALLSAMHVLGGMNNPTSTSTRVNFPNLGISTTTHRGQSLATIPAGTNAFDATVITPLSPDRGLMTQMSARHPEFPG